MGFREGSGRHTVSLLAHAEISLGEVLSDVADQVLLLAGLLGEDLLEEVTGLLQVAILHLALEVDDTSGPVLLAGSSVLGSGIQAVGAGRVVRGQVAAAALVEVADAVAAQGVQGALAGTVDGQLSEVGSQAVTLGVVVGEGPDLKNCDVFVSKSVNFPESAGAGEGTYSGRGSGPNQAQRWWG